MCVKKSSLILVVACFLSLPALADSPLDSKQPDNIGAPPKIPASDPLKKEWVDSSLQSNRDSEGKYRINYAYKIVSEYNKGKAISAPTNPRYSSSLYQTFRMNPTSAEKEYQSGLKQGLYDARVFDRPEDWNPEEGIVGKLAKSALRGAAKVTVGAVTTKVAGPVAGKAAAEGTGAAFDYGVDALRETQQDVLIERNKKGLSAEINSTNAELRKKLEYLYDSGLDDATIRDHVVNPTFYPQTNENIGESPEMALRRERASLEQEQKKVIEEARTATDPELKTNHERLIRSIDDRIKLAKMKERDLKNREQGRALNAEEKAAIDKEKKDIVRKMAEDLEANLTKKMEGHAQSEKKSREDERIAREQRELDERIQDNILHGVRSGAFLLEGSDDPDVRKLGRTVKVLANELPRLISALKDVAGAIGGGVAAGASSGSVAGPYGAAIGAVIGLVVGIVSAVSDEAPNPMAMIYEKIVKLEQAIEELRKEMHGRFDRIEAMLTRVYADLMRESVYLGRVLGDQGQELRAIEQKLAIIEERQHNDRYGLKQSLEAISLQIDDFQCADWFPDHNVNNIGQDLPHMPREKFIACMDTLFKCATKVAANQVHAGDLPSNSLTAEADATKLALEMGMDKSINSILSLAGKWGFSIPDEVKSGSGKLVNPALYGNCINSYVGLAYMYPDLFSRYYQDDNGRSRHVEKMLAVGMAAESALSSLRWGIDANSKDAQIKPNVGPFREQVREYVHAIRSTNAQLSERRAKTLKNTLMGSDRRLVGYDPLLGPDQEQPTGEVPYKPNNARLCKEVKMDEKQGGYSDLFDVFKLHASGWTYTRFRNGARFGKVIPLVVSPTRPENHGTWRSADPEAQWYQGGINYGFLPHLSASREPSNKLWGDLSVLTKRDLSLDGFNEIVNHAPDLNYAKSGFDKDNNFELPTSITKLLPNAFVAASNLGLGQIEYCYEGVQIGEFPEAKEVYPPEQGAFTYPGNYKDYPKLKEVVDGGFFNVQKGQARPRKKWNHTVLRANFIPNGTSVEIPIFRKDIYLKPAEGFKNISAEDLGAVDYWNRVYSYLGGVFPVDLRALRASEDGKQGPSRIEEREQELLSKEVREAALKQVRELVVKDGFRERKLSEQLDNDVRIGVIQDGNNGHGQKGADHKGARDMDFKRNQLQALIMTAWPHEWKEDPLLQYLFSNQASHQSLPNTEGLASLYRKQVPSQYAESGLPEPGILEPSLGGLPANGDLLLADLRDYGRIRDLFNQQAIKLVAEDLKIPAKFLERVIDADRLNRFDAESLLALQLLVLHDKLFGHLLTPEISQRVTSSLSSALHQLLIFQGISESKGTNEVPDATRNKTAPNHTDQRSIK